jgi:hypothetical protein
MNTGVSESIQIILNGIDKFTPTLDQVTKGLERTNIMARSLKGSFSFLGKIGIDMGPFVEVVDLVNEAADQAKDFGEAFAKAGPMGQAGVAAAAVAIGWQIGSMYQQWADGVEEWNLKMQRTLENIGKQADLLNEKTRERFKLEMELANAAETDELRLIELKDLKAKKDKEVAEAQMHLRKQQAELEAAIKNDTAGYGKEDNEIAQQAYDLAKAHLELLREQQAEARKAAAGPSEDEAELKRRTDARANRQKIEEEILRLQQETLRVQNPEAAARAEAERLLTAQGVTEELQNQYIWEMQKNKAVEAKAKADEEAKAKAESLAEKERGVIESLKAQLVAMREGEAAAEALRMAQDGLSQAAIAESQAIQAQIDAQEEYNNRLKDLQESLDRQRETDQGFIEDLKTKNIELKLGADAAEDYRAKLAGVSEEAIRQGRLIREENKRLEKENEEKEKREEERKKAAEELKKGSEPAAQLQATEGRMLTRGSSNPAAEMAKKTEQLVSIQKAGLTLWKVSADALMGIRANTAVPDETLGA